jgi:hypothetical protein
MLASLDLRWACSAGGSMFRRAWLLPCPLDAGDVSCDGAGRLRFCSASAAVWSSE